MRYPDFIGIGGMRCGSTWISRLIEEHPDLFIPTGLKEVHFFDEFIQDIKKEGERKRWNYFQGIEWYLNLFKDSNINQVVGEITPNYLYDDLAPDLIKQNFPNIKLFISIRNPVDRAISHLNLYRLHNPGRFDGDPKEVMLRYDNEFGFLRFGFYSKFLKKYYDYFGRENLHVIFYEDVKGNPLNVCRSLYAFLGVNEHFIPSVVNKKVNSSDQKRFNLLFQAMRRMKRSLRGHPWILNLLDRMGLIYVSRRINELNTRRNSSNEEFEDVKIWLANYYKEEFIFIESLKTEIGARTA